MENENTRSWRRDLTNLISNTTIVYFGMSAILASEYSKPYYECLADKRTIFTTVLFTSTYGMFQLGRRHAKYFHTKYLQRRNKK